MEERGRVLDRFLVEVFGEVLRTEEHSLARRAERLSLRELHLIEAVCRAVDEGRDNRSTAIAAERQITAGTLTTAVSALERKGYLERRRSPRDKRVVRIYPTEKGREAQRRHAAFHRELVEEVLAVLSKDEARVFTRALDRLTGFFRQKNRDGADGAAARQ